MWLVLPFLLAMVLTMIGLPLFSRAASKWHFIDRPGGRKVHAVPIPRIGGIAMAIGVLTAALVAVPLDRSDRYFLIAAGIIAAFGALDDRFDLDYRLKLLGQLMATLLVALGGDVQIHFLSLDERVLIPEWFSLPLTVFFVVGITNAINLADGLDGLAGGTTFLTLCAFAMLAYSAGQVSSAALALTFAGAVLGFLRFNTFPASIFMGDAGSQLLGFAVAVLSLRATQNSTTAVSSTTPLLLLALPILDTLSVMTQRVSEGRSPFSADKNHIHHKLLALGLYHHEAVMVIYAVQAGLLLVAYWLRYESDLLILGVLSLFFATAIFALQMAARLGQKFRQRAPADDIAMTKFVATLLGPQYLPRWSYLAVATALAGYALLVLVKIGALATDVRWLLICLLAITLLWLGLFRIRPLSIIEKGALYVTAAILVYLDSVLPAQPLLSAANWIAILIAATGTVVYLRLSKQRPFQFTPLDLIVLFVALVVPNLAAGLGMPHGGALGIAKLVILFYAVEVLVHRLEMPVVVLRLSVTTLLAALIIRPML
jgi:UDP-GlcNAc:undecaprenyl-phosphate/decaprenyl-phosphate GlcNAc-1-phosphate transferase